MKVLKSTFAHFVADDCMTLAASLAYYTVFALPPLLYLLLTILTHSMSLAYDEGQAKAEARELIEEQAGELIGNQEAAEEISAILENNQRQQGVWWKTLISLAAVVFGATGVVAAIQASLNRVWQVQPDPDRNSAKIFLVKRVMSLAMILGIGFLMLVSMVVSTALTAAGSEIGARLGIEQTMVTIVNYSVVFLVTAAVFAALFKFMPDAQIGWRDVAVGVVVTALLFLLGRYLLGLYFSYTDPGARLSSAAASLAVLLVWIYYSAMIFLLGAEFTQAWATQYGRGIRPESGAVLVKQEIVRGP